MNRDRATVSMEWVVFWAFVVALVAGVAVFMALNGDASTDCFHRSVGLDIARSADRVEGCQDLETFQAVNAFIASEREAAAEAADDDVEYTTEEPDSVAGRGHLAVWIALFTATAALAGFAFVRAAVARQSVRPGWGQSFVDLVITAALFLSTFWVLDIQPFKFSEYEDMHSPLVGRLAIFVGILLIPALMTMLACGRASGSEPLDLERVSEIGGTLRSMVSLTGAVLALSVITTGARAQAIGDLPGADPVPSSVILVWGAVFAVAIAIIYVPVHQRWASALNVVVKQEIQRQFGTGYKAVEPPGTPGYRPAELAAKKEIKAALGAKGPLAVLQGSFSVLAPVIAAAVSSVFAG